MIINLNFKKDASFDITRPYFYQGETYNKEDKEADYSIYCDGSYLKIGQQSFCSVGGVVVNKNTHQVICEFFGPLKTKDALDRPVLPFFERQAIHTAFLVAKKLELNKFTVFNDSLPDINHLKSQNVSSIEWIPREKNIADDIVSHAREVWREQNQIILNNIKAREKLFSSNFTDTPKLFICSSSKKNKGYYQLAVNEKNEVVEHLRFNAPHHFGAIELVISLLKSNKFSDCTLIFDRNLFEQVQNYAAGIKYDLIECYEEMFKLILDSSRNITFDKKSQHFNLSSIDKAVAKYIKNKSF